MSKYIAFLFMLLGPLAFGQVQQLYPSSIYTFPDIHPDTIARKQRDIAMHEKISAKMQNGKLTYQQLSAAEKKIYGDEILLSEGPFYTGPLGCSWYCATGPERINASSELDSSRVANYVASNMHDFDLQTAWVEGKKDEGKGEFITFEFNLQSRLKLTTLVIFNGYSKSLKHWQENGRVKQMDMYLNDSLMYTLHLQDTYRGQVFQIEDIDGDDGEKQIIRLKIKEIYEGSRYQDIAISEINFDGTGDH
ncbi:NADase-type glycan-binding domain-containing protein [Catalinimonas niigatensis]|uniref:NADase-type glycan-binding domain-containing protein n=1 Tax=Catalinimonas niigatensis TaxID=1397264 RepID=UPI002666C021|nr:hypothetical protein [Catalinimonas niigatensis]WPP49347.1 hypothetical protein PZB72_22005 [Catalinimonas niigatensis]